MLSKCIAAIQQVNVVRLMIFCPLHLDSLWDLCSLVNEMKFSTHNGAGVTFNARINGAAEPLPGQLLTTIGENDQSFLATSIPTRWFSL